MWTRAACAHTRALATGSSKAQASRAFVEEPRWEEERLARGSLGFLGAGHVIEPADRTCTGSETVRTPTMDYESYTPDSTSRVKSGYAYRVLGHDAATYYQYAIYVRVPSASRIIPTRARRPSKRVTERFAHENGAPEQTRRKTLVPSLRRGALLCTPRRARARPDASWTSMAALKSRSNRLGGSRASRRRRGTLTRGCVSAYAAANLANRRSQPRS